MAAAFSTDVLDRTLRRHALEREALRELTLARLRNVLALLPVEFESVVVFGSITQPARFGRNSDLDIAFAGLSDEDYFVVKRLLEGEIGLEVDLIQLESHRLADLIARKGVKWNRSDLSCSAPK